MAKKHASAQTGRAQGARPEREEARFARDQPSSQWGAAGSTGGASTGPRTEEGRARLAALHTTHGRLTKEKRAEAKRRAEVRRQINAEVRAIEAWVVSEGLLDRDWRAQFKP